MVCWQLLLAGINFSWSCKWGGRCGGRCKWRADQSPGLLGGREFQAWGADIQTRGFSELRWSKSFLLLVWTGQVLLWPEVLASQWAGHLHVSSKQLHNCPIACSLKRCPWVVLSLLCMNSDLSVLSTLSQVHGLPGCSFWWHVPLKYLRAVVGLSCGCNSSVHRVPALTV